MQGVKELISKYKKPFNRSVRATAKAKKNLRERGDKLTAKAVEEEKILVLEEWDRRATFGTIAHDTIIQREMTKYPKSIYEGYTPPSTEEHFPSEETNKLKLNTRYFEKKILSVQNRLVGYIDELYIDEKGYIHITEIKSFKELRRTYTAKAPNGFYIVENFFNPIEHIIDCNFSEMALQASFYMYMCWMANKKLKPGTITLKHLKLDEDTGVILEEKIIKDIPFLLGEVKSILKTEKIKYESLI